MTGTAEAHTLRVGFFLAPYGEVTNVAIMSIAKRSPASMSNSVSATVRSLFMGTSSQLSVSVVSNMFRILPNKAAWLGFA